VQWLLSYGADVNVRGENGQCPIHWAVQSGDLEVIKLIVQAGADPLALCDRHKNALWYLWSNPADKWYDVASYLIGLGLDVNSRDIDGFLVFGGTIVLSTTPVSVIELFLSNGLDLSLENGNGRKPLRDYVEKCVSPAIKEVIANYRTR
jgi:hypothetical protein